MASARALGGQLPTTRGTFIGKGRGRGAKSGAGGDGTKPGTAAAAAAAASASASSVEGPGVDRVLHLIETAASSTNSQSLAEQVLREAEISINTSDELKELANSLFQWALQSPDRAKRTAVICNTLGNLEIDNVKFFKPFVQPLNKDFVSRDEWKGTDEKRWLSLACLVCQFFNEFKLDGQRIHMLTDHATTCVELMLKSTSVDSQKYGIQQLCDVGPALNTNKVDDMMDDLRHRLLASETHSTSRVLFLEALECYAGSWKIDDSATDYYTNKKSGIV